MKFTDLVSIYMISQTFLNFVVSSIECFDHKDLVHRDSGIGQMIWTKKELDKELKP